MKIRLLTAVLLAAAAVLTACGKETAEGSAAPAPEEQTPESVFAAENIPLEMDPVFRSTNAKIGREEMAALGFEFGDSLTLSFSTGLVLDDIPYHDGYYVKPGNPVAVSYPGLPDLNIALNLGDGSWDVYGFKEGDTVSVSLNEKADTSMNRRHSRSRTPMTSVITKVPRSSRTSVPFPAARLPRISSTARPR